MKILNTFNEIISVECDRCRCPLWKDKDGYYVGAILIAVPTMINKDYCLSCYEYLKQVMES